MNLLVVANKTLPENDYRVAFAKLSRRCRRVCFALPGRPSNVDERDLVRMGFGEGLSVVDFRHFLELYRYLRSNRAAISMAHFYSTKLVLLGPLLSVLAGVPCIVTVTGFGRVFNSEALRHRLLRPVYWKVIRAASASADAVLFQNHGDRDFFIHKFPQLAAKCRHVGSGVTGTEVKAKDYLAARLRVLLVARLLPSKGIEDFLAIARMLAGEGCDFRLIGPPSQGQEALLRTVQEANRAGVVSYLGELSSEETARELRDAHVLLFTSHGEGMSRVMLEAGFAAVCPVAYDISANLDLVEAGRGFLVPRQDTSAAAAVLRHLVNDREALEANAQAYQSFVVSEFSSRAFAERLDAILASVLPADLPDSLCECGPAQVRE